MGVAVGESADFRFALRRHQVGISIRTTVGGFVGGSLRASFGVDTHSLLGGRRHAHPPTHVVGDESSRRDQQAQAVRTFCLLQRADALERPEERDRISARAPEGCSHCHQHVGRAVGGSTRDLCGGSSERLSRYPYRYILVEKPPYGYDWPLSSEEVSKKLDDWLGRKDTQVIFENQYAVLAEGNF